MKDYGHLVDLRKKPPQAVEWRPERLVEIPEMTQLEQKFMRQLCAAFLSDHHDWTRMPNVERLWRVIAIAVES